MISYPFTPEDAQKTFEKETKPVEYNISDFGTGFADENLPYMAIEYLTNNQDFPADENYNPNI